MIRGIGFWYHGEWSGGICASLLWRCVSPRSRRPPADAGDGLVPADNGYLRGKFLVATARIGDPRFSHTVIYMIQHDAEGAMGLVVNRAYGTGPLNTLLEGFGIDASEARETVRLHYGGPVEPRKGFVLHSDDYEGPDTRIVASGVAVSTGADVLEALAAGAGPERRLFILGYAGWGPGQLEGELARDDWVTAPADASLLFSDDLESLWDEAISRAGVAL